MLLKMHGTENVFYLYDVMGMDLDDKAMSEMTKDLCQDGSDGMLFVCDSEIHLAKMRIFNSDGSEPEMCGNGLRCLSRYVLEKFDCSEGVIETLKAAYSVKHIEEFHGISAIQIVLYPVKSLEHPQLKDFDTSYSFKHYTVSNPHIVGHIEDHMTKEDLTVLGEYANNHFDEGMNVNMLRVIGPGKIYVQTFERGVGITKSCGTGMTSSSVDYAIKNDYFDKAIEVYNDGGMIECQVIKEKDYKVLFTGNATYMSKHDLKGNLLESFDEDKAYKLFFNKTRI
ncbi:diaminopimelate epimerase [Acidaminobacter sp. JC074]|uniref:diaminopimelate epimerase n=1 Tax=Acidaminobacter sp. JC074 TaxID=2530199 RepID=UPI001F0ED47F|nr:diaminopimelate epimerase [Acidaminobacter sp. JC074]